MQIFQLIAKQNLNPNQFYLLCCMKENVQPIGTNIHQDLRTLLIEGFVTQSEDTYLPTTKADELINEVESHFKIQKKKTAVAVMGSEFSENVIKYNEIFPKLKLPSGKVARTPIRIVELGFKWFFENHKYSWETILKATMRYVDEYEIKSPAYIYMRTSGYFICKMSPDRIRESTLAEYCDMVDSGEVYEAPHHFKDKVL